MKLNQKTFLRRRFEKMTQERVESRDAILWDIIPAQRVCRVKIQGSNELITAYFPQNVESNPQWLKIGNSVRIAHKGGVRGYIEIAGHGTSIPTSTETGLDYTPTPVTPADGVINGCNLVAPESSGMTVLVKTGSVRFSGTTYTVDAGVLGDDDYVLGSGGKLSEIAAAITIAAAPSSGLYRIDIIVIGSDLVIDYVQGTAAAIPVQPDTPSGHLLLGTVFVPYGTTEITMANNINKGFLPPRPATITIVVADSDLDWSELSTGVTISVYDQYGNLITPETHYTFTVTFAYGNGKIDGEIVSKTKNTSTSSITFNYVRDHVDPGDSSPLFLVTLDGYSVGGSFNVVLRDSLGAIMA